MMLSSLFLKALDLPQKKKEKRRVQRRHTFHGDADKDKKKGYESDGALSLVSLGRRLRKKNGLKDEEAMVSKIFSFFLSKFCLLNQLVKPSNSLFL